MKFLADECCDAMLVDGLRKDGHDVVYAKETLRGEEDDVILQAAAQSDRVLLTEDKDFGERLVLRLRLPTYGVVLLRLHPADSDTKLARMREVIQKDAERMPNHFVVIEATRTRFRLLADPPAP